MWEGVGGGGGARRKEGVWVEGVVGLSWGGRKKDMGKGSNGIEKDVNKGSQRIVRKKEERRMWVKGVKRS